MGSPVSQIAQFPPIIPATRSTGPVGLDRSIGAVGVGVVPAAPGRPKKTQG
jgi:hypothetical protein